MDLQHDFGEPNSLILCLNFVLFTEKKMFSLCVRVRQSFLQLSEAKLSPGSHLPSWKMQNLLPSQSGNSEMSEWKRLRSTDEC